MALRGYVPGKALEKPKDPPEPPRMVDKIVTRIEMKFPFEPSIEVNLDPADQYTEDDRYLTITFAHGEIVVYNRALWHWCSIRRVLVKVPAPKFVPEEAV